VEKSLLLKKDGLNSIFSYGVLKSCTYLRTEDFQDKGSAGFRGKTVLRLQRQRVNMSCTTENAQGSKPVLQNCKGGFVPEKQALP